mmetsp:Transcript_1038/g.3373  ORF Transcript_1038/g.3373 Transcript_1038/m.3373 type:complete len:398 (-) Transcript_1038:1437-2630(-)
MTLHADFLPSVLRRLGGGLVPTVLVGSLLCLLDEPEDIWSLEVVLHLGQVVGQVPHEPHGALEHCHVLVIVQADLFQELEETLGGDLLALDGDLEDQVGDPPVEEPVQHARVRVQDPFTELVEVVDHVLISPHVGEGRLVEDHERRLHVLIEVLSEGHGNVPKDRQHVGLHVLAELSVLQSSKQCLDDLVAVGEDFVFDGAGHVSDDAHGAAEHLVLGQVLQALEEEGHEARAVPLKGGPDFVCNDARRRECLGRCRVESHLQDLEDVLHGFVCEWGHVTVVTAAHDHVQGGHLQSLHDVLVLLVIPAHDLHAVRRLQALERDRGALEHDWAALRRVLFDEHVHRLIRRGPQVALPAVFTLRHLEELLHQRGEEFLCEPRATLGNVFPGICEVVDRG